MTIESDVATPVPARRHVPPAMFPGVAVALLVLLALAAWWDTSARELRGGSELGAPVPVGHTLYVDLGVYPARHSPTIQVYSMTLDVATNTAGARLSIHRCTRGSGPAGGIGAVIDTWQPYCSTLPVFRSGALRLPAKQVEMVLAIAPTRPGLVKVDGVDVRYRHLLRFGHQHVGGETTVTATLP